MNDINNPLEDIKVETALRSEKMKLEYRKANNPENINILDYTVIAALEKQTAKKAISKERGNFTTYECPCCGRLYWEYIDDYCSSCGQKLDGECEV
ncbi:hypothetical protein [Tissierella praeacuta]|uniref:hypothetical protein n=1 Tax=Tissierella praeacuta TaxID=43131 RepID=UPI0033426A95